MKLHSTQTNSPASQVQEVDASKKLTKERIKPVDKTRGSEEFDPQNVRMSQDEKLLLYNAAQKILPHTAAVLMRELCTQNRGMFSTYVEWDNQTGRYIPDEVAEIAQNVEFQKSVWHKVRFILKDNRFNQDWTMQVLVMLAIYEVIERHAECLIKNPNPS